MRKKLFFKLSALSLCAIVLFSSCLDSSENSNTGYANGVVRHDVEKSKMLLDVVLGGAPVTFYASQLDQLQEGDCCSVKYEVDLKQAENLDDVVKRTGYYVVSITQITPFDKQPLYHELVDTAHVLEKEAPINNLLFRDFGISYPLAKGYLFSCHVTNQPIDEHTKWWLSYDVEHLSEEVPGGVVYDLFLRATIEKEGQKKPNELLTYNAYHMEHYMKMIAEREKAAGRKDVVLRFNYVSAIQDSVLTWKKTQQIKLPIGTIL